MSINLSALMKQRYDTAANWTAQNPTLLAGEIGIESDTKKWKVGTGSTAWTSLVYAIGGTYPIVNADIAAGAGIVDTKLATIATAGKVSNSATTAASANTASAIVARDASGNFTAGIITAALTGAASANVLKAGDTMTGVLAVTAGTAALPGIAVSGDTNTGIYSPGADQLAISTGGTGRVFVDATGRVGLGSSPGALLDLRSASAPSLHISETGFTPDYRGYSIDLSRAQQTGGINFTTSSPSALLDLYAGGSANNLGGWDGQIRFFTGGTNAYGTERARIDSSGRLLVGTSSSTVHIRSGQKIASVATGGDYSGINSTTYAGASVDPAPIIDLAKSRGSTDSSMTSVISGDVLGYLQFRGADGTNFVTAAEIKALVDGTPGSGDMPGRLVFSTTADGAASPTERYRITNDGLLCHDQPTPATYAAAATLTVADLKTGIITYTGTAATLTLPTGTLTEGGFAGIYTNMTFEWSVINTGAGTCTIGAGTAHTIVGSGTVAIGASARFTSRRTAANTFVSYRLS
jgi:hypothetical protein